MAFALKVDAHRLDARNGVAGVRVRAAEAGPWISAVLDGRARSADLSGEAEVWLTVQSGKMQDAQTRLAFSDVSIDTPAMLKPLSVFLVRLLSPYQAIRTQVL